MDSQFNVSIRYAADLPVLRYIIPFSYSHNGMSYDDAKEKILATSEWIVGKRKDLTPSKEEDLYDHVYESLIDSPKTHLKDTNIGMFFIPKKDTPLELIYSFYDNGPKKYAFSISDVNIYIFKTGIGFYVYEASLPQNESAEGDYVKSLTIEQLILFQNRFKELNVIRGYFGKKENEYRIYSKGQKETEFYTLGREIAIKLNRILGDVFYFPPRVNEILKHQKISEIREEKKTLRQNKQKINKKKFEKREDFWENITVSDFHKLSSEDTNDVFIVPDKALLYSYVVMNSTDNISHENDKEVVFSQFCKNLYYLTRGYKPSYKVSDHVADERRYMFRRHENDFWDASLEGAGDFVLIYDNLFETNPNTNEIDKSKQKTNLFFDKIRPLEMRGDYFILYILLLYQHYSVVFFSKKIAETIPMQKKVFINETEDSDEIYRKLRDLKLDVNMFFANCMFEAVGQITDMCTIYSFIEGKLHVKKNIESLQRGINDLDALREEIQNKRQAEKDSHINKILSIIGILAVISIVFDTTQFVGWLIINVPPFLTNIGSIIIMINPIVWIIAFIVIVSIVVFFILLKKKSSKKRHKKKKRD